MNFMFALEFLPDKKGPQKMNVQFLLFVIAILLVLIFWELSKINSRLKKTLSSPKEINTETKARVA
jgi:hypothetical protein